MSAWTCRLSNGKADPKIVPPRPRIPCWKGLGADSEEKREPVSDIDTAVVDSLKVLDLKRPIREADMAEGPEISPNDRADIGWAFDIIQKTQWLICPAHQARGVAGKCSNRLATGACAVLRTGQ